MHLTQFKNLRWVTFIFLKLLAKWGHPINSHYRTTVGNYDVNNTEKGGQENKAYETDPNKKSEAQTDGKPAGENDPKWVSNYVPYGDYPKGNIVYVKEVSIERV